jgi:hypothetical protein
MAIVEHNGVDRIDIVLPPADDRAWQVPGLAATQAPKTRVPPVQVPEWQLVQAITAADLSVWPGAIEKLVTAAERSPYHVSIVTGWARAACYQQRCDWIEVLLARSAGVLAVSDLQQLLAALPATASAQRQQFFTRILTAADGLDAFQHSLELMMTGEQQWSLAISQLVVQQLDKHVRQERYFYWQHLGQQIGKHLDPGVLPALAELSATLPAEKQGCYRHCIEILTFRRDLQASLRAANTT